MKIQVEQILHIASTRTRVAAEQDWGLGLRAMDDLLHCPRCRERFGEGEGERRPKLLQCHHTYCLQCLRELQATQGQAKKGGKSVACPACSKVTSVGKKGVSSLQDNFYITTFRSTLEMQASETESAGAVDDIYISDEEDQQLPAVPPADANDWCKTCKRVTVPACVASKHNVCNLLKMIEGLLAQFGDLVLSQLETREPLVHALQSTELALFGVLHGLQEDISSQDMLLSMARSEKQWLLAVDLTNKTTSALADRFSKLDLQLSAAVSQLDRAKATSNNFLGLRRAVLNLEFGGQGGEKQSVTLEMGGDTDNEKALRYLLYKMMQVKKINVPEIKPEEGKSAEVDDWKVVGSEKTSHKVYTTAPGLQPSTPVAKTIGKDNLPVKLPPVNSTTSLPVAYNSMPQRASVQTVAKAVTAPLNQPSEGMQHAAWQSVPTGRQQAKRKAMVKSIGLSTHNYHCFFEIEVNGKSIGTVVMKLRPDVAPKMCSNFVTLCTGELGYGYKGSRIFKVHANSFVVGGDFENNDGSGGYSIFNKGYFLGDDCNLHDCCGALRMRGMGTDPKTGAGRVGSQFHIWVGEKEFKDYKRTLVFGHVVKGLDLLQYISGFKTIRNGEGDYFLKSVVIIKNCGTM
ncbi:uncharacterized protein LOC134530639 isoform X2 [Bacillus rossius redtenbacheri]|uniref:uncharacterized protein LOC134530639 isoform X2 n=1 Tax=Bacillus rossius redtenbacheri TaxID=93214 RepID=UPI002FDD1BDF